MIKSITRAALAAIVFGSISMAIGGAVILRWKYDFDPVDTNYPMPDFIVFNVYETTNRVVTNVNPIWDSASMYSEDTNDWVLLGWSTNELEQWSWGKLLGSTTNLFFATETTNSQRFLSVTASNIATGLESQKPF